MLPILMALGAGLLKHELVDKPEAQGQRNAAAAAARFSPWSGMGPESVGGVPKNPSLFNTLLQSAALGAMFGGAGGGAAGGAGAGGAAGAAGPGFIPATENPNSYWGGSYNFGGR